MIDFPEVAVIVDCDEKLFTLVREQVSRIPAELCLLLDRLGPFMTFD